MPPRKSEKQKSTRKAAGKLQKAVKSRRKPKPIKIDPKTELKCLDWLDRQNAEPKKELPPTPDSDEEDANNQTDDLENATDFDIPFKKLPKRADGVVEVLFECEWASCKLSEGEFRTEKEYFEHMALHARSIEEKDDVDEEELYFCEWDLCDFDCEDKKTLVRHLYTHAFHTKIKAKGASFCATLKVPFCKLDSKRRNVVPDQRTDFFCHWADCSDSFVSMQDFVDHVRYHIMLAYPPVTEKQDQLVKCGWYQCNKSYMKACHMQNHVVAHTGEKLIACFNCGQRFVSKYKFLDHLKRQMEAVGTAHQCPQCVRCFPFEKGLRTHLKSHVNCFKCSLCDMTCGSSSALATHIRYRHLKERPYQCLFCEHKTVTKRDLEMHMNTHEDSFFLRCPFAGCDYVCKAMVSLKKHQELKHGGPAALYKCHICEKTFHYSKALSKHLVGHHKFQHPSGHLRFTYKQDFDCFYKLQLSRVESLEVTKEIMLGQEEGAGGQSPASLVISESEMSSPIKRVEDFDVMKRYLKNPRKEIAVEIVEIDAEGHSKTSKTMRVRELVPN